MSENAVVNVGLIGHRFMGKAHTHAYTDVTLFFDPQLRPVKHTLCAKGDDVAAVAENWGWQHWTSDWREMIADPDIDVVDICAPSILHKEIAIASARAGKHIFCEKPLAMTLEDAREMLAAVEEAGVTHTIGFNYRKVPALGLAKQLIDEGQIGRVFHFRGMYSQDWLVDPGFPLAWRLRKKDAGAGSSWDLGAHVVDLARYLIGEVDEVVSFQTTFIKERPIASFEDGLMALPGDEMGEVDVDDATAFLARFANGAMGVFEFTRFGTGHRNQNRIEVYGSEGALIWNGFEEMSNLHFYSRQDPGHAQGFRVIQVGESSHPYGGNWWPVGHVIGFGDTFVHEIFDFLEAIAANKAAAPSFVDGVKCQEILVAVDTSAAERRWVKLEELI
ncbi:MAG: Gfo/Idh/MocA family oxidoreductase [Chloroflexota bacterium]